MTKMNSCHVNVQNNSHFPHRCRCVPMSLRKYAKCESRLYSRVHMYKRITQQKNGAASNKVVRSYWDLKVCMETVLLPLLSLSLLPQSILFYWSTASLRVQTGRRTGKTAMRFKERSVSIIYKLLRYPTWFKKKNKNLMYLKQWMEYLKPGCNTGY